jgi:hypothetical protein
MSRAFRDTFKQIFCFGCQKIDRRGSTVSFPQLSTIRKRPKCNKSSVPNEQGSTYNYSTDYRTSIAPIEDDNIKKKKTSFQFPDHSTTLPLLNENNLNGVAKNNSYSS